MERLPRSERTSTFDAIVLGAGPGGLTVAVGLARFGRRVALVERGEVGGDCTNVGCVPSKTLIHLAAGSSPAPPATVLARVRARRDRLRREETAWIEGMENVTLVRGTARFAGPREVSVDLGGGGSRRLRGGAVVIATGSRPATIPIPGLPARRTLTNETMFELEDAPARLAIVGAGAVGCEMAFAFARLGARVVVIQRGDRVLGRLDPEVDEAVRPRMAEAGIEVLSGARPERYEEGSRTLTVRRGGTDVALVGIDRVLLAVGRRPNLDLDLHRAGVSATDRGIPVDGKGRTNVRRVRALGDVTVGSAGTHAANAQGRRLVRGLALPWLPAGPPPVVPGTVFAEPEVAHVGPSRAELEWRFAPELLRTVRVDLAETDRAYTMGLDHGFVQLHALRLSGRLLSATLVAPAAGETVPLLTLAVQRSVRLWTLSGLVFPYPVLAEAIKKAADAFAFDTLADLRREAATYLRLRLRPRSRGGAGAPHAREARPRPG